MDGRESFVLLVQFSSRSSVYFLFAVPMSDGSDDDLQECENCGTECNDYDMISCDGCGALFCDNCITGGNRDCMFLCENCEGEEGDDDDS